MNLRVSRVLVVMPMLASVAFASVSRGDETDECQAASKAGQIARRPNQDKLLEAARQFHRCAQSSCPSYIQEQCVEWLAQVESRIPSVVLIARDTSGAPLFEVSVTMDGEPLVQRLDGKAIPVDPGAHTFSFVGANGKFETRFPVSEGKKAQEVIATIGNVPNAPDPTPTAPTSAATTTVVPPQATTDSTASSSSGTTVRTLGFVIGGAGIVGIAAGAFFGLKASSKDRDSNADGHCDASNFCDAVGKSARADAQSAASMSTISFIAGGILLGTGVALVALAPKNDRSRAARVEAAPILGLGNAGFTLRGRW